MAYILMLVGDYVEDYEVMVPFQALRALDYIVHVVCPGKERGQMVATAVHDIEGDQTYIERPGHAFQLNASFSEVRPEQYLMLLIPGGRAPEYIRLEERVLEIVRIFASAEKPIAAIGRGVLVLTASGMLEGRVCTGFPTCEPEVRAVGGEFMKLAVDQAHVDGNLVTAPAWPALAAWLALIYEQLGHLTDGNSG